MGKRRGSVLLATIGALGALAAAAPAHAAPVHWLCSAAKTDDPCDGSQATTLQDRTPATVVTPQAAKDRRRVDCFYVYPTVSNQEGRNATFAPDPEIVAIAQLQAARFATRCRVFVPLYRQLTLSALFSGGFSEAGRKIAYGDVRAAFRSYLRRDNDGRGIVLIGHSQGTGVLRQLIADTVDRRRALRKRLVAAYLLGGNVTVREGSDRGGDFRHVPLCTKDAQAGCVVAWSTFGDAPPEDARFGRPPTATDRLTGKGPRGGLEVACTNPADLAGNEERTLRTVQRGEPFPPGLLSAGIALLFGGEQPTAATPFVVPADRYAGRCVRENGAHVLRIRPLPGARVLTAAPDATWGLHLADANIAQGDLVRLLGRQVRTYERAAAARRRAAR